MVTQPDTTLKLLPRVIILALVIALGQLWLNHHLGWGGGHAMDRGPPLRRNFRRQIPRQGNLQGGEGEA